MLYSWTAPYTELIKEPIALCDGMDEYTYLEHSIQHFIEMDGHNLVIEKNLYSRNNYDLSQYKTIIFRTLSVGTAMSEQMKKVFSFDKKNLELVIALNSIAFGKVKVTAKELGVKVLGLCWPEQRLFDPYVDESLFMGHF